jgi:transcriptional regulator with XRE-family HTH domain
VTAPEWAQRVTALRRKLGLRQAEFGKHFGVTQAAVSKWESGQKGPSVANYIRLGNLATDESDCFWFWEKAGVDIKRIRNFASKESRHKTSDSTAGGRGKET